jgi:hypothetical protein
MSRRVNVKRRVTAAAQGARIAGVDIARIEVDREGRVVIVAGKPTESADKNALDAWMAKNARAA